MKTIANGDMSVIPNVGAPGEIGSSELGATLLGIRESGIPLTSVVVGEKKMACPHSISIMMDRLKHDAVPEGIDNGKAALGSVT